MIFDRFGTRLTLLSKPDGAGWIKCISHYDNGDKANEIQLSDTRAEDGALEITRLVETLPDFPTPALPWPTTIQEARKLRRCYVCNCDTTELVPFSQKRKPARTACQSHSALLFGDGARLEQWRADCMKKAGAA